MKSMNKFIIGVKGADFDDLGSNFEKYQNYLQNNKHIQKNILEVAKSDWYYDPECHQCPHDSWIESIVFNRKKNSLIIELLGSYHDCKLSFSYEEVEIYDLTGIGVDGLEWNRDEFEVTNDFNIHHIEMSCGSLWRIKFRGKFELQFHDVT